MKNKFYLCLLALAVSASSCNKEEAAKKLKPDVINVSNMKSNLVIQNGNYYDLDLLPRAAGQNYDTYHCVIANADIYVTNVYWDSATYPTLTTGVPLYGTVQSGPMAGNTSTLGEPYITYVNQGGIQGTQFILTIPVLCGSPGPNLQADIEKFQQVDLLNVIQATSIIPNMEDYIASDYGTADCPMTVFRLKLIRSSTSSTGFAVADAGYSYTPTIPSASSIKDIGYLDYNGVTYNVKGYNKIVTEVHNYNNSFDESASGNYGQISGGLSITATFKINGVDTTVTFLDED